LDRRSALDALLALGVSALSRDALAQDRRSVRRVGYLLASVGSDFPQLHSALRTGLRELGYVEGQNVEIVVRSADGNADRFPALVAELVQQRVSVIFAANTAAAVAAAKGAPDIPVVFAGVGDPVGLKLVQSLARPGGNATGIAMLTPQLTPKRLELLKEAVPAIARVAVLTNPDIRGHEEELRDLERTAGTLHITLQAVAVQRADEFEAAFAAMTRERVDGLVVLASPLHHRNLRQVADLALRHRLPAICEFSEFTDVGGLMVYGPSWQQMYRHAAVYVVKILEGVKAADLPVEQPTTIDLVVNLATAKALGLDIPRSILLRARSP